jgi:hypothetical protein
VAAPVVPTGTLVGDLLVMVVELENVTGTTPTVNSSSVPGWDPQGARASQTETGGAASVTIFTKIHDGTAMPTLTWDLAAFPDVTIYAVSGVNQLAPIDSVSGFQINAIGSAAPVPGLTTTSNNCLLLAFACQNWGLAMTPSGTWVEDYDDLTTEIAHHSTLAATAGTVASQAFTVGGSTHSTETAMLAIAPPTIGTVLTGTATRPWVRIIAYDDLPFSTGQPIGTWTAWQNLPGSIGGPFIYPRTTSVHPSTKVSGPWVKTRTGAYIKTGKFQTTVRATGFKQSTAVGLLGKVERLYAFERPPIRHTMVIDSPVGATQRWAFDAPHVQNVLSDASWGSTMPGGWDRMDASLFRKPELRSSDIEPFSRVTVYNAGGKVVGQFRVEQTPATHGDSSEVQPGAVGYQSELDDNKAASFVYVDADSSSWSEPLLARQILLINTYGRDIETLSWQVVKGSLKTTLPNSSVPASAYAETWLRMPPGQGVVTFQYKGTEAMPVGYEPPNLYSTNDDVNSGGGSNPLTLDGTIRQWSFGTPPRFLVLTIYANGTAATGNKNQRVIAARVFGYTGILPRPGTDGWSGVFGSDAVQHAISTWTDFTFTTGSTGTIVPSTFVIPHLIFRDLGAVSDIVRGATRFGLQDWAVWESNGRTDPPVFWWHPRRYYGSTWRARVGPSKLNLTGTQVARVWNSVVVQYHDALTGETRSVGPPGANADASDPVLNDSDPQNPATVAGKTRRALLQMQTTTLAGATKVGQIFLDEQKLLDSSGDAEFVGWVQDDHGVWHAASDVRAGDYVEFVDSNHPGARRIVNAKWSEASKSMHVDLDSPPDAMEALLERLQVVLVPLGDG